MSSALLLPPELWQLIFDVSEPRDLLRLGEACHELHNLVSQIEVWLQIVKTTSIRYGLLLGVSPKDPPSLRQLQSLALSLSNWGYLMRTNSHLPGEDAPKSTLPQRSSVHLKINDSWKREAIFLVPGGRYLITVAGPPERALKMWDLGLPGSPVPKAPARIAYHVCEEFVPDTRWVGWNREWVRIGLIDADHRLSCIYEISPFEEPDGNLTFRRIASFKADGADRLDIQGDRVLIKQSTHWVVGLETWFTVWDIKSDKCITWALTLSQSLEISRIVFTGELVLYFRREGVQIYSVPELTDTLGPGRHIVRDRKSPQTADATEKFNTSPVLPFNISRCLNDDYNVWFTLPYNWTHRMGTPFVFDVFPIHARHWQPTVDANGEVDYGEEEELAQLRGYRVELDVEGEEEGAGHRSGSGTLSGKLRVIEEFTLPRPTHTYRAIEEMDPDYFDPENSRRFIQENTLPQNRDDPDAIQVLSYSVVPPSTTATGPIGGARGEGGGPSLEQATSNASVRITPIFRHGTNESQWSLCPSSGRLVVPRTLGPDEELEGEEVALHVRYKYMVHDFLV